MIVTTNNGTEVELTEDEEKVVRAINRLGKMNFGRICMFGASGTLHLRIYDKVLNLNGDYSATFDEFASIPCDGGDGGDDFNAYKAQ